jgi:hypothetical protein
LLINLTDCLVFVQSQKTLYVVDKQGDFRQGLNREISARIPERALYIVCLLNYLSLMGFE